MTNRFTATWQNPLTSPRAEIAGRLILSTLAIVTCCNSLWAPSSIAYRMLLAGGVAAKVSIVGMGILGALLLADALINEIMPARYSFPAAKRYRQGLWMTLGCLQMAFAFLVFTNNLSFNLGCYLVVYAFGAFLLAFIDAATEKMHRQMVREWSR